MFDANPGEEFYVRGAVTAAMAMSELAADPVIRGLRAAPDKLFGMALSAMPGWSKAASNAATLHGVRARWYVRDGNKQKDIWVPAPSEDYDLLG